MLMLQFVWDTADKSYRREIGRPGRRRVFLRLARIAPHLIACRVCLTPLCQNKGSQSIKAPSPSLSMSPSFSSLPPTVRPVRPSVWDRTRTRNFHRLKRLSEQTHQHCWKSTTDRVDQLKFGILG